MAHPPGRDAPCRVVITFGRGEARVRTAADCGFNVELDGVYVREKGDAGPAG